jgi:hypothetical protein
VARAVAHPAEPPFGRYKCQIPSTECLINLIESGWPVQVQCTGMSNIDSIGKKSKMSNDARNGKNL